MPSTSKLAVALAEAFDLSEKLDKHRECVNELEVMRLQRMFKGHESNRAIGLMKKALVADIQRDYETFDASMQTLLQVATPDLWENLSSLALYAHNIGIAREFIQKAYRESPDSINSLAFLARNAWLSGDLPLFNELVFSVNRLGGKLEDNKFGSEEINRLLNDAGIAIDSYAKYIESVHSVIRRNLANRPKVNLRLNVEPVTHEDGSESIVCEIMTDLEDEDLERLDDDILEMTVDDSQTDESLRSVMSYMVRDIRPFQSSEVAS